MEHPVVLRYSGEKVVKIRSKILNFQKYRVFHKEWYLFLEKNLRFLLKKYHFLWNTL